MTDIDIHSCGYYCDRHACIVAQRNELRDKLFGEQWVKTYSDGKPNYTQPIEQEPVAYMDSEGHLYNSTTHPERYAPLYTAPPKKEWVGLTEQEQSDIAWEKDKSRIWIVTATEAKLKEKNT
jgi:hypothetical protein